MTYDNFFTTVKAYYGENKNREVMAVTESYIKQSYQQKALLKLLNAIYRTHRSSWGYPDVAAVELAHDKFMKSDSVDLKESKVKVYQSPIPELTDEEISELQDGDLRKKWLDILTNAAGKATERLDPEKMEEVKRELSEEKKV